MIRKTVKLCDPIEYFGDTITKLKFRNVRADDVFAMDLETYSPANASAMFGRLTGNPADAMKMLSKRDFDRCVLKFEELAERLMRKARV